METFQVDSCIQGYHTGEELNCVRERTNTEDPYAVAAIRHGPGQPRVRSLRHVLLLVRI